MDHFGIGAAMQSMLQTYTSVARQTGRTTSLIASLHNGDRIVCADPREQRRLQDLSREWEINVTVIVVNPKDPVRLFDVPPSEGRTLFEHTWVEAFYAHTLVRAQEDIDRLQCQSSGFTARHTSPTGRTIRTEPEIQNVPIRTPDGDRLRKAFGRLRETKP